MIISVRYSSLEDRSVPLQVVYLGHCHEMDISEHPQGSGLYLWYFCVQGRGEFVIDGERIFMQPGQAILTCPETSFSCRPSSKEGCCIDLIGFTGPCCKTILSCLGMDRAGLYMLNNPSLYNENLSRLSDLPGQNASQKDYSKLCYCLLMDLDLKFGQLDDMKKETARPGLPVRSEAVRAVLSYLELHYSEPVSLDLLADLSGLCKEHLCVVFKRETGRTILSHLTLLRIGRARLFLEQYPDKTVGEIGRMCGFESPAYFGKRFRQVVGMTPESYRRVNSVPV